MQASVFIQLSTVVYLELIPNHPLLVAFSELLTIYNWSQSNRLIQNTCTYEIQNDSEMDFLKTYLVSATKNEFTGDYLFVYWNQTHETGDGHYALNPTSIVGQESSSQFHRSNLPEASIPGYATYFWFMPDSNKMATITFGSPRSGMNAFSYWMKGFLKTESRYARFDNEDNFLGYSDSDATPIEDLEVRFTKSLHKNPSKQQMIINNHSYIKSVIRRIRLDRSQALHTDALGKLKELMGISGTQFDTQQVPLNFKLDYQPSRAEIISMIDDYENSPTRTGWEDVGFVFPESNSFGAEPKEWLSKSFAKTKVSFNVDWVLAGQLVNGSQLLNSIVSQRTDLISLMEEDVEVVRAVS